MISRLWCVISISVLMHDASAQSEANLPPIPEQETNQPNWLIKAANTLPHPRQVAWQDLGLTCFIHFGPNTFTDREWGDGLEDPNVFQPGEEMDAEQWVVNAKAAGMKMMLITVKHHDGFCTWQTRYTKHSVAGSSWRNGTGDVLRELSDACAKHDLQLGVYLSPADLYQIEQPDGLYGNLSRKTTRTIPEPVAGDRSFPEGHRTFTYDGIDDYNAYMLNQLYELLTEYGPMYEVWFDGAHPKRKGGQTYNYEAWFSMIRELAPEALIAIKGPDARWVGNESGHGRANEFSVLPIQPDGNETWGDRTSPDLGSRAILERAHRDGMDFHWYPAEVDTSIRGGWFYHAREDGHPKIGLQRLINCYFDGPGNNGVLLLNIPPDRRGLFHESDVAALHKFSQYIDLTFSTDHAAGAKVDVSASRDGHGPSALTDSDDQTFWQLPEDQNRGWIQLDLGEPKTFDVVDLREYIRTQGQRIEAFTVEALINGQWQAIGEGGTVGHRKALRIDQVIAQHVRVHITSGRANASLHSVGLYNRPLILSTPAIRRSRDGMVSIAALTGAAIYYTLDGSVPTASSNRYDQPFKLVGKGQVRAVAMDPDNTEARSDEAMARIDVPPARWTIHTVSSEQADAGEAAANAIDGDPNTIWHSKWRPDKPAHPHEITIDFGETLNLAGFSYLPRTERHKTGCILAYRLEVSMDGLAWQTASEGIFQNMTNNPTYRAVMFGKTHKVRYMRLISISAIRQSPFASAAEVGVITE